MFCSNCGSEIADGANFCTKCGQRVGSTSPIINTPTKPTGNLGRFSNLAKKAIESTKNIAANVTGNISTSDTEAINNGHIVISGSKTIGRWKIELTDNSYIPIAILNKKAPVAYEDVFDFEYLGDTLRIYLLDGSVDEYKRIETLGETSLDEALSFLRSRLSDIHETSQHYLESTQGIKIACAIYSEQKQAKEKVQCNEIYGLLLLNDTHLTFRSNKNSLAVISLDNIHDFFIESNNSFVVSDGERCLSFHGSDNRIYTIKWFLLALQFTGLLKRRVQYESGNQPYYYGIAKLADEYIFLQIDDYSVKYKSCYCRPEMTVS